MKRPWWGSVEPGALESILEQDLEFAQVTVPLSVTWVSVKRVAGVGQSSGSFEIQIYGSGS